VENDAHAANALRVSNSASRDKSHSASRCILGLNPAWCFGCDSFRQSAGTFTHTLENDHE